MYNNIVSVTSLSHRGRSSVIGRLPTLPTLSHHTQHTTTFSARSRLLHTTKERTLVHCGKALPDPGAPSPGLAWSSLPLAMRVLPKGLVQNSKHHRDTVGINFVAQENTERNIGEYDME